MIKKMYFSKGEFFNDLSVYENFDRDATSHLGGYSFVDSTGVNHRSHSFKKWLDTFNDILGTTFDIHRSVKVCGMYKIVMEEAFPKAITGETEVEIKQNDSVLVSEKVSPDWGWINCLNSNREDKERFDKYASDKFGIELKRNKSLENMIKDFKDALEDK